MSNQLNYDKVLICTEDGRLDHLDTIEGIDYYYTGEDMSFIYAVDHTNELACRTDFFEMDDFYIGSDYLIVKSNDELVCAFKVR